jgi:hypothetical protein
VGPVGCPLWVMGIKATRRQNVKLKFMIQGTGNRPCETSWQLVGRDNYIKYCPTTLLFLRNTRGSTGSSDPPWEDMQIISSPLGLQNPFSSMRIFGLPSLSGTKIILPTTAT